MGMSPDALYALELREFCAAYEGWSRLREQNSRERWEIARWSTAISISPHIQSNKPLNELLPLPWDEHHDAGEEITMEQRCSRAAELLKYLRHDEQEVSLADNQD